MSRKFEGKCLFYSPRIIPEVAMSSIELGGLDGFNLEKNSSSLRGNEAGVMMRKRCEGGFRGNCRSGESNECRLTTAYPQASISDWNHRRRENDNWRA